MSKNPMEDGKSIFRAADPVVAFWVGGVFVKIRP